METELLIAKRIASKYYPLSDKGLKLLASIIERQELKKGEIFLSEGQISQHLIYLGKGLLRQFYYKNGRDITEHFTCEGAMTFCIISVFNKEPTHLMVESLEPSTIYNIPYNALLDLADQCTDLFHLIRRILEWSLIISQQKADSWRFETARERYDRFIKEYPEAAKRASVNHIASYLLMTPESLSRVRAGIL
ncbi:MAG: Crp/Fnr family transcriptional regulator [Dysgonomonas sp.]